MIHPRGPKLAALAALALLTAACGPEQHDHAGAAAVDPATLCVSSDCGSVVEQLTIPDAENILFSDDGRLFVSGGLNVYEITRDDGGLVANALYQGSCNFTGLAIIGDVLYANCFDGRLYAARLTAAPALQPIHALGLAAPNGLVAGPDHDLYLVNGPLATTALPDPKIVRLTLDPADPFTVQEQTDWFSAGLLGPNGLQRSGRTLYVSNTGLGGLGEIRTVTINADNTAGASTQLASFLSVPDDFSLIDNYILSSWYLSGQIALIDPQGSVIANTDIGSFSFPSQVRVGRPPLFPPEDLLITEKGLIGDTGSSIGNVLSVFRRNG
ncbi:hypothetical protein E4T66_18960 [Sinimarinibacterium sp. CAU 1509]|uniref:hypothetical protein n=1 Tax=Sinimarinibacterium sp. CAU 1509 TaxID=2562283 RepID=UPI0010ABF46B|nr:hypothetical protein [Sinimarinibacterium sp. CAU 1509]TJY56644.1 hypothetical protein E4T66_18960 [Sinimarinibacterium sp. CAU 1509]